MMFVVQLQLRTMHKVPSATYVANIKFNLCKPWIIRRAHSALKRRELENYLFRADM